MMDERTLWEKYGSLQKDRSFSFGPYYSYQFRNTPRHILFTLARYKFAAKMIGQKKKILELGCNEGLGSYYLSEFSDHVHGVDLDEGAIAWAKKNMENEKISFQADNFLGKEYGKYSAVVSIDVLEHIYPENEELYLQTLVKNMVYNGICIVGTPNIVTQKFADQKIAGAHVNLYSAERLVQSLETVFHNVFLFSQNDEMIHTGYTPMANYLLALCTFKKK